MTRRPTRPTHVIKVMDRSTGRKGGRVGAAWVNPDGSISIHLDTGVTLSWNDGLMITAFENDRYEE
jgi:hypothetical protein